MSNVVDLPVVTTLDIDPNKILNAAIDEIESGVIIGWDKNKDFYFASSQGDLREVLLLLELAKKELLEFNNA